MLPSLGALTWTPRCRTGMVTDDEDDVGTPGPPAPTPAPAPAPAPPRLLTERQREAVYQFIREETYEEYEHYLEGEYPGAFAEAHEKAGHDEMMREWEEKDKRRKVDYDNTDAFYVWNGTADEVWNGTADEPICDAAFVIAHAAREAVKDWGQDLYAHFDSSEAADYFDAFARTAAAMVEDRMRESSAGFFDEEAEYRARVAIENRLNFEMDPN